MFLTVIHSVTIKLRITREKKVLYLIALFFIDFNMIQRI